MGEFAPICRDESCYRLFAGVGPNHPAEQSRYRRECWFDDRLRFFFYCRTKIYRGYWGAVWYHELGDEVWEDSPNLQAEGGRVLLEIDLDDKCLGTAARETWRLFSFPGRIANW